MNKKRKLFIAVIFIVLLMINVVSVYGSSVALPASQVLYVDGEKTIRNYEGADLEIYNINGNNYFKLRDVAAMINFSVEYDYTTRTVVVDTSKLFAPGTSSGFRECKIRNVEQTTQAIVVNDELLSDINAYNIEGQNFFKLRDLSKYMGFKCGYVAEDNAVFIISPSSALEVGEIVSKYTSEDYELPVNSYEGGEVTSFDELMDVIRYAGEHGYSYAHFKFNETGNAALKIITEGKLPYASSGNYWFNSYGANYAHISYTEGMLARLYRDGKIEKIPDGYKEVYDKAIEISSEIINDSMSDYEKVKAIHDYISENTAYGKTVSGNTVTYTGHTAGSVLLSHVGVCEGFSKAFSLMCAVNDIPCDYVTGYIYDSMEGHAWNRVELNGEWYNVDVTYDSTGGYTYNYFLVSDNLLALDRHTRPTMSPLHECKYNYR